eukprot:12510356-Ditylum_brightwellii.AAC.1
MSNEWDAPHQIMLPSMDANYDVLLAFSLTLEIMVDCCEGEHLEFVFCPGDKAAKAMKHVYYRFLKDHALDAPGFCCKYPDPLGTHSTREFGMINAAGMDATRMKVTTLGASRCKEGCWTACLPTS